MFILTISINARSILSSCIVKLTYYEETHLLYKNDIFETDLRIHFSLHDQFGNTMLHIASRYDQKEVVQYLSSGKASSNIQNCVSISVN